MPGIVGLVAKHPISGAAVKVQQMVAAINHRPASEKSGYVAFDSLQAVVGWVVADGSFSECLPIWNEQHNVCLLFVGEHFSDGSDRNRVGVTSHRCALNAQWLVRWYEQTGDSFLPSLNGAFRGVIADFRFGTPKLILFNDRFGQGRIYFHEDETAFYFASEAKALLRVAPNVRQLDSTALAEFFACGCTLHNRSLFAGIHLLPVAAAWTWEGASGPLRQSYFDPEEWKRDRTVSPRDFYDRFEEVFTRIVPRYCTAAQPIGMSVTGGVDSRMIMAALRPEPDALQCYTFGGMYRECADVRIGRLVARACQQQHQVIRITPEFFTEFPDLATQTVFLTDGVMDVTGASSLYLNRHAADIAPIRLTGNYGGEILRGIVGLKCGSTDETIFDGDFASQLREVPDRLAAVRRDSDGSFVPFKQVPWFHYAMYAAESSQLTVRTPYLDNELVALTYQTPPEFQLNKNPAFQYISDSDPRLSMVPNDRGSIWDSTSRLDARRSRLTRLREEFLPRAEYAFDYGMPNWLVQIDRVLSPLRWEKLFLGNQKFAHYRLWYRRELSGFVKEVLLDPRTLGRSFLNRRRIEQVVLAHINGRANNTLVIHKLLTAELMQRSLVERF